MRVEIHAVLPPGGVDFMQRRADEMVLAVEAALKGPVKDKLKGAFAKRTANWSGKPEFAAYFSRASKGGISLLVSPRGRQADKWKWVSGGTPRHRIEATNAPLLRFQQFYDPKTKPGNKYGGSGRKSGPWVNTKSVSHPGIFPRDFETHIVDDEGSDIIALLEAVIRRVLTT
jgi:hypothetical protein